MNPYLVFIWDMYEALGGMKDLAGMYGTLTEANAVLESKHILLHGHIYDCEEMRIIKEMK